MKFLHRPFNAKANDRIKVTFSKPTKILLIHSEQFKNYKGGRTYTYRGGFMEKSPAEFTVPFPGTWHAVIEKGTYKNPLEVTGNAEIYTPGPATLNGTEQTETSRPGIKDYDDTLE